MPLRNRETEAHKMVAIQGETVELRIPYDPKYIIVARLVAGGVGARAGLNIDDIDELKVAVSEACTNAIEHAANDTGTGPGPAVIVLRFTPRDDELQVEVEDYGAGFDLDQIKQPALNEPSIEGGLGLFLIHQLTDEVDIQSAPGSGTKVIMTKRRTR